jgi:hypothetical protein
LGLTADAVVALTPAAEQSRGTGLTRAVLHVFVQNAPSSLGMVLFRCWQVPGRRTRRRCRCSCRRQPDRRDRLQGRAAVAALAVRIVALLVGVDDAVAALGEEDAERGLAVADHVDVLAGGVVTSAYNLRPVTPFGRS